MTIQDYLGSRRIALKASDLAYPGDEFYSTLMAAMRFADTDNRNKLRRAFPEVWEELNARYNSPGGALNKEEADYLDRIKG